MPLNPKMKTIVIDDMLTMRKIITKMLKQIGFTDIHEADDGATAWPMIEEALNNGQPFEFIVSDWNMPKMSGLELLERIRKDERTKKLPFLMITAEAEQSNVLKVVKAGVSNFVVKPFTPETLKGKIDKIFP
ncbi:MAG: response regulator [Bdellovibrio sp. CG12_big_fil_rev_8_21_14_0_65_39_13]|nr:MAG: response regulator [Bdellovibrio sp. CG22_combo_CG10-13_8_21_14_all_39_27]PIQ61072.1 MAG: response regulator [Bdellovibrio sp. CG12_big_fil_rev_8_21_14_0_65_39_13]PIR36840.1 MAG: response regulator [Bdellovibrio sp. CG11_big_fil_rev_8_21_14_0_20_39_38]